MKASVFDETYQNYLSQLAGIDFTSRADVLGVEIRDGQALVPLLGRTYRVSPKGVLDPFGKEPLHAVSILLCRYLLLCPEREPQGDNWVTYRDFRDAAPFVGGFISNTGKTLEKEFSKGLEDLREACQKLGAVPVDLGLSYQIVCRFEVLPKIPILLLFNDEDEEFSAQGALLFQEKAAGYLDMECLAIVGWLLTDALIQAAGKSRRTVM